MNSNYTIVRLANGTSTVRSLRDAETFHPVIGPVAEAEALYVNQLRLRERLKDHAGEFVIWDVGLGAAANALTVLRATAEIPGNVRLVSFDHTLAPLDFALQNADELGYFADYEACIADLLKTRRTAFQNRQQSVSWEIHLGDFPSFLAKPEAGMLAKPHAILFDAFSPARNAAMWTLPLFTRLFELLDPNRPCVLPTYSRSTMLRVTLLLAGFHVGVGHATGFKEETTIAANDLSLLAEPLDAKFLQRTQISYSAEPMHEAAYRQMPLSPESLQRLLQHPQFQSRPTSSGS